MNKIKRFLQRIKPKAKYILGILGIAAIVSQGVFAFDKLSATGPKFNFMQNDYELLRGVNVTKGDTTWKDPISGSVGDEFAGSIYYHNGILDTTAENTRIKVTIPTKTTNKTATLSATISADNASTVTDTVVDGQIVGESGLTLNLDQDANLELIPGSVKWYPAQFETLNTAYDLPNGQTGNEIVNAGGINIGDIQGCWDYAGFVKFKFRATKITNPLIDIDKTVRNITVGETNYVEITNANASDVVEFKINAKNAGDADAKNAKLSDVLPVDLTYVAESMKISSDNGVTWQAVSATNAQAVFATGWSFGDLLANNDSDIIATYQARAISNVATQHTVTNVAKIASGILSDSDDAKVTLLPCAAPNIVKNKDAKNLTTGEVATANNVGGTIMKTVNAKSGDVIEYTLTTKNTGNAVAEDFQITDGINDILEEANFVSASDSGSVFVTGFAGDDHKMIQYPTVDIAAGETVVRTFTVKVMDPLPSNPQNGYSYDHKLYNFYGDKVLVVISIPTPPVKLPYLNIAKTVRNVSSNESAFVESNYATIGDTLEYKVAFSNTGDADADSVVFSDILPAHLVYLNGSTVISVNGGAETALADGIVGNGVTLDKITVGESGYIKFRVIADKTVVNNSNLINTAYLTDNGVTISDTASTIFRISALPKTGANTIVVAIIAGLCALTSGAVVYRRFA